MFTVVILAAGYGSRMGPFSRMINKALVPYNNKPLISHIIDKFNFPCKFIIACGHLGNQLKDYVTAVHENKDIIFVDIKDYSEKTTGPASSLLQCEKYIENNFLVITCDTLFEFDFSDKLDKNWIGVYPADSTVSKDYCWVKRNGNKIVYITNKEKSDIAVDAFIGLIYCKDKTYLNNIKKTNAKEFYTAMLDNLNLEAYTVYNWKDFGTHEKWAKLNCSNNLSLTKPNEIFYMDNNKVVKFNVDSTITANKYNKALQNKECMPKNIKLCNQFLVHEIVEGDILYPQITISLFKKLLLWANNLLWVRCKKDNAYNLNKQFYYQKTIDRLIQFRIKHKNWSEPNQINETNTQNIEYYLDKIDWELICSTTEWAFIHGDFQFENIIYNNVYDKFTCIDWRPDFASDYNGDIYYDIAKVAAGIYCNYQLVRSKLLLTEIDQNKIILNLFPIKDHEIYISLLKSFCEENNLSWNKVELLIPLVYLNMSPLHETPYDKYLISLSQLFFSRSIQ